MKPKKYIETRWLNEINYPSGTQVFQFKQPVEFLNGKPRWEYHEDSDEQKNWAKYYWESYKYNEAVNAASVDSKFWTNNTQKEKVISIIHSFILNGKSVVGSSITHLFPFEVYLLNNGYDLVDFGELNKVNKGRIYQKENIKIYFGFGYGPVNFFFTSNNKYWQVPINEDVFHDAMNFKLKTI